MSSGDVMSFPNTWEEYEEVYGFNDTEQIYTNGSRLIQSFRVKQWLEHIEVSEDAISRKWIKNAMLKYGFTAPDMTVTELIEDAPTIETDAEPVVRCRDCFFSKDTGDYQDTYFCYNEHHNAQFLVHSREYCSHGKKQPRHGKWVSTNGGDSVTNWYECSECGGVGDAQDRYCRHCGSNMEE